MLEITEPGYQDFRQRRELHRAPAEPDRRALRRVQADPGPLRQRASRRPSSTVIEDGPGEGQRLLPVENTTQTVDIDLIGNTMRAPERERLSLILNELGTGVAGPRARPQRGHPARQPGAARDRQGARDPGQPEHRARAARGQLRHGPGAAGARPRARGGRDPQLERRRPRHGRAARGPGRRHPDAAGVPRRARADDGAARLAGRRDDAAAARPRRQRRRTSTTSSSAQGPFSQAAIPAVDSLGEAAKVGTPGGHRRAARDRRPAHAGEQRPARSASTCARCSSPSATRKASSA